MPTVNLHKNYNVPLVKAFEYANKFGGKFTEEYKFTGVNTVVATSIVTDPLNDYDRTAAAGRYGTTSEVDDSIQTMVLQKDRSYSKTVDKGNYKEGNELKTGAAVTKAYYDEQVGPETETFVLSQLGANAGTSISKTNAPTAQTIIALLTEIEVAMDDARVPAKERYVVMPNAHIGLLRQSLLQCNDITDKLLLKGIVGQFGSLHVMGVPASSMPTKTDAIAWQKSCAIFPKTIDDAKVSYDVPGISGLLCEGRFRYGAFVLTKRAKGVVKAVHTA